MNDLALARAYVNKANSCKSRKISFDLSLRRYRQLRRTRRCFYTGVELTPDNFSLDRIDAGVGYTDSNTVACDLEFNQRKSNLTMDDMVALCRALRRKKVV